MIGSCAIGRFWVTVAVGMIGSFYFHVVFTPGKSRPEQTVRLGGRHLLLNEMLLVPAQVRPYPEYPQLLNCCSTVVEVLTKVPDYVQVDTLTHAEAFKQPLAKVLHCPLTVAEAAPHLFCHVDLHA